MSRLAIASRAGAGEPGFIDCDVRCLVADGGAAPDARETYLVDGPTLASGDGPTGNAAALAAAAGVVVPVLGASRARALLAAGARRVLLGEAALAEGSLVATLAEEFGTQRIGVYVPARRFEVSWSFDTVSNADFRVLTPSLAAPAWEILRADGTRTGTQALWWIGAMLEAGAAEALLRVDIDDDADLNLCADCQERFGARVWIGPLDHDRPALHDWVRYGQARRLALPPALYAKVQEQAAAATASAAQRAA